MFHQCLWGVPCAVLDGCLLCLQFSSSQDHKKVKATSKRGVKRSSAKKAHDENDFGGPESCSGAAEPSAPARETRSKSRKLSV